jgi:hypothetical protein
MGRQSNRNAGEIRISIKRYWMLWHSMCSHAQLRSLYLNMLVVGHGDEGLTNQRCLVLSAFECCPAGVSHAMTVTQH